MIKTIIIQAILFCAIVCPLAYGNDDSLGGTPDEIEIRKPTIISTSHYDIDHDGKKEIIEIIMEKGRKIDSEEPWCGGGEQWEGNFSIQARKGTTVLFKRSLNEIMGTKVHLTKRKGQIVRERMENETLSFWAPKFTLVFRDYNKDGQIDFNLGQYGSCSGNVFWLLTIAKDGKIEPLLVDGFNDGFYVEDPRHFNSTDDPILEFDQGLLKYSTYNRQVDIEYTSWYKWDGKQLTSVKSKKVCFKHGKAVETDDCEK